MSYILDALRKSDQQRQHATAPTLLTAHSTPDTPRQRSRAFNAWLAVILIGAGMLIGWLQPWQNRAPPAAPQSIVVNKPTTSPDHAAPRPTLPDAGEITHHPAFTAAPAVASPSLSQVAPSTTLAAAPVVPPESPAQPGAASDRSHATEPTQPGSGPVAQESTVLTLDQLPAATRQEMPAILIAFHQYSNNPAERRVMINNVLLHQGGLIAPGLKLEQITTDGVVISYQGYQFRRGVR